MLVNENLAKNRVHAFARVSHGGLEVHLGGGCFLAAAIQRFYPLLGVINRLVDFSRAFHRFTTTGHDGLGLERAQRLQCGRPFFKLRIAGVHASVVLNQVAREQDFFFGHPGDGVAPGMTRAGMPDLHLNAAKVKHQLARHLALDRVAAANHQRRPSEAGHTFGVAEQARKTLHLALHVLRTALHNQLVGALAGNDLCSAFCNVGTGAQHTHRVVMREQHILDRFVADRADTGNQVLRHSRRGGGIAHHDELVADDHARVRVTLGGIGPAMGAELLESDFFVREVGLRGKGFGHGRSLLGDGRQTRP